MYQLPEPPKHPGQFKRPPFDGDERIAKKYAQQPLLLLPNLRFRQLLCLTVWWGLRMVPFALLTLPYFVYRQTASWNVILRNGVTAIGALVALVLSIFGLASVCKCHDAFGPDKWAGTKPTRKELKQLVLRYRDYLKTCAELETHRHAEIKAWEEEFAQFMVLVVGSLKDVLRDEKLDEHLAENEIVQSLFALPSRMCHRDTEGCWHKLLSLNGALAELSSWPKHRVNIYCARSDGEFYHMPQNAAVLKTLTRVANTTFQLCHSWQSD